MFLQAPGGEFLDRARRKGDVVGTPVFALSTSLGSRVWLEYSKLCGFSFETSSYVISKSGHSGRKRLKIATEEPSSYTFQAEELLLGEYWVKDSRGSSISSGCGCPETTKLQKRVLPSPMLDGDGPFQEDGREDLRIPRPMSFPTLEKSYHAGAHRNVDDIVLDDVVAVPRVHSVTDLVTQHHVLDESLDAIVPRSPASHRYGNEKDSGVQYSECMSSQESSSQESSSQEDVPGAGPCRAWKFDVIASVQCQNQMFSCTDVIGSIVFDKSNEFFATGGIARKIRVYSYETLLSDSAGPLQDDDEDDDEEESKEYLKQRRLRKRSGVAESDRWTFTDHARCCVQEVCTPAKLSSLQWYQEKKNVVACGDYDGVVAEWDVERDFAITERDEHGGKRIWSIDYNKDMPDLIASASDDGTVRMWDNSSEHSVATISSPNASPVCCAEFGPASSSLLALACADSNVYVYDTRIQSHPLLTLRHHQRAASYVRFLNRHYLVSSSIDSTVKLWNIANCGTDNTPLGKKHASPSRTPLLRTFDAHYNVRNFTGLSVWSEGGLIACGSETNQAFAYDSRKSGPIFIHDFSNARAPAYEMNRDSHGRWTSQQQVAATKEHVEEIHSRLVSAVCFTTKPGDCTLVSANSDGVLRVIKGCRT